MIARHRLRRLFLAMTPALLLAPLAAAASSTLPAAAASLTTPWRSGAFSLDTGGVVSRSDIVIGQPNTSASQFLPLGNGSLGAAA